MVIYLVCTNIQLTLSSSATSFPKYQKFPSQITMFGTSWKGPPPRGGTCSIHDRGGLMELYIANPKKYMSLNYIFAPQKYLASKFPTQKNTRLKYLKTDLFNQTDSSNEWFCINKLMKLVCALMSFHPPLCSTFTHRSSMRHYISLGDV